MTDRLDDFRFPETGRQKIIRYLVLTFIISFGLGFMPLMYSKGFVEINTLNRLGQYMCYAIVAISLDLIWGYTGLLCLCQALFFCLGGYAMGMFLAHHGGPEGIIDANNWGKIPACLFVVYPGDVGQSQEQWTVPFFWKPFWTLPMTILLGMLIPGIVAGIIGFFVFRSRVRGVFFAVLTQAMVLAAVLFFSMNEVKLCGTNGLTRFDRIILGSRENVDITFNKNELDKSKVKPEAIKKVLSKYCRNRKRLQLSETSSGFRVSIPRNIHAAQTQQDISKLPLETVDGTETQLGNIAHNVELAGFKLNDKRVKFGLYLITFLSLIVVYMACRVLVHSRLGHVLVAVRDNESRLRFSGYKPYQFKMLVFAVGAMIAGLGGLLYTPQKQIITPHNLHVQASIMVVIWVAVGGRGRLIGAIVGAILVNQIYYFSTSQRELLWFLKPLFHTAKNWLPGKISWFPEYLYSWTIWQPTYWPFMLGGLFVGVVLLFPTGLVGLGPKLRSWFRNLNRGKDQDADNEVDPRFRSEGKSGLQQRLSRIRSIQRQHEETYELSKDIVSVDNLTVVFDGFKALDIEHYGIPHYQLNVIIGPNGAGKTTLCDVISGKTPPTTGRVTFADRNITNWAEPRIARLGVGRKFQTPSIFDGLTVTQNMELALPNWQGLARNVFGRVSAEEKNCIATLLERVRLDDDANRVVRSLSHGQRQWLEISMLILSSPQLLLVDEPAAGLTDEETILTAELLLELQEEHSIIVIEHDMDFVRLLDAPVTVLNEGLIMAQGSMAEVQANEKVVEAYLGR